MPPQVTDDRESGTPDDRPPSDRARVSGEQPGPDATTSAAEAATPPPARTISRRRLLAVNTLIAITTLLLIVGIFSVWANRLLFNPDNWSRTSTELLQNPAIRATTANYLVDELYANVDVTGLIRSGLPDRLQPLAAPAAGALRGAAVQGVELALSRPRVQDLWANANRAADQAFITVVNGGKGAVGINQGVVTLNLGVILDDVAARLGLPSDLSTKLPPQAASITVLKSDQLGAVQTGGKAIKGLALWLTILVPVLYAVAILLAPGHRRRTLMTVGFAGAFAGIAVLFGRTILESQVTNALATDASMKATISATIGIATGMLSDVAGACVLIGLALVAAAWFAGPARVAQIAREAIAPFLRDYRGATYGIALGLMVLVFIWDPIPATGTPAGILTLTALALVGTEVLIRQTAVEFPDAEAGAAMQAIRTRIAGLRRTLRPGSSAAAPAPPEASGPADQLRQLAELERSGVITADEFRHAKARVLND